MNPEKPIPVKTAVFDVCDTLYYSNTTHDFVSFVLGREPGLADRVSHGLLNNRLLPFRYLLILISVRSGRDLLRTFNISLLKGLTRQQLAEHAEAFVTEYLEGRKIVEIQDILRDKSAAGIRVVLCSSSIEPVVNAIARALGIPDFAGTSLQFEGDVFTGKIFEDISNRKLKVLRDKGLIGDLVFAVSDNAGDLELLAEAKDALAVVHRGRKLEFWQSREFEVKNLSL